MRILVCGSRSWRDAAWIYRELDERSPSHVIHGGAAGADSAAGKWAARSGVQQTVFRPQWSVFGKRAGVIRNQLMLDEGKPDLVLAFRCAGVSIGTDDMIRRAQQAGVRVEVFHAKEAA